jgi:hypothetical protein
MSDGNSSNASGGIGIAGLVFAIFLVLKLIGHEPVASWSWWWVTSPLWISFGAGISLVSLFIGLPFLFVVVADWWQGR